MSTTEKSDPLITPLSTKTQSVSWQQLKWQSIIKWNFKNSIVPWTVFWKDDIIRLISARYYFNAGVFCEFVYSIHKDFLVCRGYNQNQQLVCNKCSILDDYFICNRLTVARGDFVWNNSTFPQILFIFHRLSLCRNEDARKKETNRNKWKHGSGSISLQAVNRNHK